MDDKLLELIENLGAQGADIIYLYFALEYGTAWILIGLLAWGFISLFKYFKNNV